MKDLFERAGLNATQIEMLKIVTLIIEDLLKEKFDIDIEEIRRKNSEYSNRAFNEIRGIDFSKEFPEDKSNKESKNKMLRKTKKYQELKNQTDLKKDEKDENLFNLFKNNRQIGSINTKINKNLEFDVYTKNRQDKSKNL